MADNIRLTKAPIGILGTFDMKVEGRNPGFFGDVMTPVADLLDHYALLDCSQQVDQTVMAIGAKTVGATLTPPNGCTWRLIALSSDLTLAAADTAFTGNTIATLSTPGGFPGMALGYGALNKNGATGLLNSWGYYLPRPLLMPLGSTISFRTLMSANLTVAATVTHSALVQLVRL